MWWNFLVLVGGLASGAAYRLPGDVRPVHYDLAALYDLDPSTNFSYFAVVQILLTVVKPTSKIMLHAQDLIINHREISLSGYRISDVKLTKPYDLITISINANLEKNRNYTLTIPFNGHLKTGGDGVYIGSYNNKKTNSKEYLIATQFHPIFARRGFPCFDEPMYKATFHLTLGFSKGYYSTASNMPLKNTLDSTALEFYWPWHVLVQELRKSNSEYEWAEFQDSLPMSTYLVAFVISRMRYVRGGAKLKVWCRPDAVSQASYAAAVTSTVLAHLEKFLGVPFPLPKLDIFALPDSVRASGGWGLITYRETALLYDREKTSLLSKERIAETIAHELVHQWFGGLVTMMWWSDLWLSEGLAAFLASAAVAAVESTWQADMEAMFRHTMVLELDAMESAIALEASTSQDDMKTIGQFMNPAACTKGAVIIRMMTRLLGTSLFKQALHGYLTKFSYRTAEARNLWVEMTPVSDQSFPRGVNVQQVMDTWIKQAGYPLLTISRDYGDDSLTIHQRRFLSGPRLDRTAPSWWVPLMVLSQSAEGAPKVSVQWLGEQEGVATPLKVNHGTGPDKWVLFNADMIALYRVNYDKRNWQLLSLTLVGGDYTVIPVLARVQLLSDAFALAWSNQLDYTTTLQLASYLQREHEYFPLKTGLDAFAKIETIVKRSPEYGAFQKYLRRLITETYHESGGIAALTQNKDNLLSIKMQVMMSEWACRMHVVKCEDTAMEMFRSWMGRARPDEDNPIPLDLRRTVYCVSLSRGSVREWRFALERMQRANVAAAREQLLEALACSRETWILQQYLEWTIGEGSVLGKQDAIIVITSIMESDVGYQTAKEFIYSRVQDIHNAFKNSPFRPLGSIVQSMVEKFTSQKEVEEFNAWYAANEKYFEESQLLVKRGLETAVINILWTKYNQRLVVDKFREYSSKEPDENIPLRAPLRHRYSGGVKLSSCAALILVNILITLPV